MSHPHFEQSFAHGIYKSKYAHPGEEWPDTAKRTAHYTLSALGLDGTDHYYRIRDLITAKQFMPGGRYLYAAGRDLHQTQNCLLLRAEDTREGWAELSRKSTMALMTGAGIGVDYSAVRESGRPITRTGGIASGPLSLMNMVNEVGRNVMQGGSRRSAIWAGLAWWHPDVFAFIDAKNWSEEVRALKEKDFTFPAALDMTNISVILDKAFFDAYSGNVQTVIADRLDDAVRAGNDDVGPFPYNTAPDGSTWMQWATRVYEETLKRMLKTAEPGFSVDYDNRFESLRNACTEVTSEDDSDVCNLGSINMSRFDSLSQFEGAVRDGTLFLMAGTVYSDLPYDEVYETREKNRRLGLGLMGIHEWLLKRGKKYGPDDELEKWLQAYERSTEYAADYAERFGLSVPTKTRAIAPTGTIGIVAETTTGIEPIFCAAYKRRLRNASANGDTVQFEYVVDPTAKRLIDQGVDPSTIEDAYTLSYNVERRIEMQAWVQRYVDHGISSTINMPYPITDSAERQDFSESLMPYLSKLRGVTVYPDGARGGQPLTPVDVEFAMNNAGVRFEESAEKCVGGECGA